MLSDLRQDGVPFEIVLKYIMRKQALQYLCWVTVMEKWRAAMHGTLI